MEQNQRGERCRKGLNKCVDSTSEEYKNAS